MNLYEQENNLLSRWKDSWPKENVKQFCMDGFCYERSPEGSDNPARFFESKPRIVFVCKDMNNNPGEDVREWPMYDIPEKGTRVDYFYVVLLKFLWALNTVTENNLPVFDKSREEYIELAQHFPFVCANLKKYSGEASVTMDVVFDYAYPDIKFLKEQIVDLYNPTVIYCGGGDKYGRVKDFVINEIYSHLSFEKVNDRCYYSDEGKLLVIDAHHPKAHKSDYEKFDEVMALVQDFLACRKVESLADITI